MSNRGYSVQHTNGTKAQHCDTHEEAVEALRGDPEELVIVETMPDCHRASHRAAGNWGVYPANGAERTILTRAEADEILASDPDEYASIVRPAKHQIRVGMRVSAGSGEDADEGQVQSIADGFARVGWDSGVVTPADLSELRPA